MLISALLSAPDVLANDQYDLFFKATAVSQLTVSILFLLATYIIDIIGSKSRNWYRLYQWVCIAGVLYALLFTMFFIYRNMEYLGISLVMLISYIFMVVMLGGPFVWCFKQSRKIY